MRCRQRFRGPAAPEPPSGRPGRSTGSNDLGDARHRAAVISGQATVETDRSPLYFVGDRTHDVLTQRHDVRKYDSGQDQGESRERDDCDCAKPEGGGFMQGPRAQEPGCDHRGGDCQHQGRGHVDDRLRERGRHDG